MTPHAALKNMPITLTPKQAAHLAAKVLVQGYRDRTLRDPLWWRMTWAITEPLVTSTVDDVKRKSLMTRNLWAGRSVVYRCEVRGEIRSLTDGAIISENFFAGYDEDGR